MIDQQHINVESSGEVVGVSKTEIVKTTEFFKIYLDREIQIGENISVSLNYDGLLQSDMVGLYYSDYVYDNGMK
jgi:hypothetical protein